MCRGCSSEKSLPSSPAASRPPSLDLTGAKQLEESPEFLDPVLLPLESPSGYSAIASSHNSLQSNFDPQQLVLPSTQWPRPPSTVVVRLRPKSPSTNFFHAEGPPFYGSAVPRDYSRNSKNRNTIYMTMVREVQWTYWLSTFFSCTFLSLSFAVLDLVSDSIIRNMWLACIFPSPEAWSICRSFLCLRIFVWLSLLW